MFVPGLFEPEVSAETSPAQIQVLHSEQLMFDQVRCFLHAFFDQTGTVASWSSQGVDPRLEVAPQLKWRVSRSAAFRVAGWEWGRLTPA